jgi:hypothetical protein
VTQRYVEAPARRALRAKETRIVKINDGIDLWKLSMNSLFDAL